MLATETVNLSPVEPSSPARGRYVVLDGGEGVGKSTQVQRLQARLSDAGIEALVLREPGGDAFAEAGRELLLGDLDRTPQTEVLLFNALRVQLLLARVIPQLESGIWVLSDRSRLSTITYQGYGHGADLDWTRAVCDLASGLCAPDLEIVLTLDEATASSRRTARGTDDRFERLGADFHRRVADGYLAEAARSNLPLIDGSGTEAAVEAAIWATVEPLIPYSGADGGDDDARTRHRSGS